MSVKAIETVYNGYRFRSRLEARWAVFFDTLGIRYEYEKEGYALGGIDDTKNQDWYLPDFWLPDLNIWIEIKGEYPTEDEKRLADLLSFQSGKHVFIFFGSISIPDTTAVSGEIWEIARDEDFKGAIGSLVKKYCPGDFYQEDWLYETDRAVWSECDDCGSIQIRDAVDFCTLDWCCQSDLGAKINSPRLIAAYTAARQARFEHGERG